MTPPPIPPPADLLCRAALAGAFDPRALIGPGAVEAGARLRGLAPLCEEIEVGDRWLWTLRPEARAAALAGLPPPGPERARLLAGRAGAAGAAEPLGQALRDLLAARPGRPLARLLAPAGRPGRGNAPDDRLLALFQAHQLLARAGVRLAPWADGPEVGRRLKRAVVQNRREAEARAGLQGPLRGRYAQLRLLSAFAATGGVPARDRHLLDPLPGEGPGPDAQAQVQAVLLTGIGGAGKSALVEALRRRLADREEPTPVVFDLDRAALAGGDRVALTLDLLHQAGLARPALDRDISAIRSKLRAAADRAAAERSGAVETMARETLAALGAFAALLSAQGFGAHPFVLILDTFEEALVAGAERVRLIADWIVTFARAHRDGQVRLIVSGRSAEEVGRMPTTGIRFHGALPLGDLGPVAARSLLGDLFAAGGIPHRDLVPDLVAAFGSNALVIQILARFCAGRPRAEIEALAHEDGAARGGFTAEHRQRFLYRRILDRLHDPAGDLGPLASPGLVLRQITPELISGVLAGACGLPVPMPSATALDLYRRLRGQVWLVREVEPDRRLVHLPDLRRLMLPLVLEEAGAGPVRAAAIAWYGARDAGGDPTAAWERLYYRALTDAGALPDDDATLQQFADAIGGAVADLPEAARARIGAARGQVLTTRQIGTLSGEARRKAVRQRRSRQMAEGLAGSVIDETIGMTPEAEAGEDAAAFPPPEIRAGIGAEAGAHGGTGHPGRPAPASPPRAGPAASTPPFPDLPEPDLIRARFAAADFDGLAALAMPALARALSDASPTAAPGNAAPAPALDDPAYLACLALLGAEDPGAAQEALHAALDTLCGDGAAAPPLARAVAALAGKRRLLRGEGPLAAALLAAHATGFDARRLVGLGGNDTLWTGEAPAADTLSGWRLAMLLSRRSDEPSTGNGTILPVFAPEFGRAFTGLAAPLAAQSGVAPARLEALRRGSGTAPPRLDDYAGVEAALASARVVVHQIFLVAPLARLVLHGRLTELHTPLRTWLFGLGEAGAAPLREAVAALAAEVPWWPGELAPRAFEGRPNSTLLATLIDIADRCGRLPMLIALLAGATGAPALLALNRIAQGLAALWDRTADQVAGPRPVATGPR